MSDPLLAPLEYARKVACTLLPLLAVMVFFMIQQFTLGCSKATGPYFQQLERIEAGIVVVYFYRPSQIGSGNTYWIFSDGKLITALDDQGYYPYIASPGRFVFSLSSTGKGRNLVLNVEAGQTYFVKLFLMELLNPFKSSAEPMLIEVSNHGIAFQEIQNCRLMQQ